MQNRTTIIIYLFVMYVTIISGTIVYGQTDSNISQDISFDKNSHLISSATQYLKDNQLDKATQVLNNIDYDSLTENQSVQVHIIEAKIYLNSDQSLQTADFKETSNNQTLNTQHQSNPITYTTVSYNPDELANQTLWQKLIVQDKAAIDELISKNNAATQISASDAVNNTLLGWLELAKLTKEEQNNNEYFRKIQTWQNKFREHPAKNYIAELQHDLSSLAFESSSSKKIVALLPFTGNLAPAAKAIKDGMLTAYFNDKNPTKPELIFIDTHNNSHQIEKYYHKALENNPDLIIGPLDKASVQKIRTMHTSSIPMVALNYVSDNQSLYRNSNFFQFGISAENEAAQAAIKTSQSGLKKTLIIVDDTDWGYRVSKAFEEKFESLNGMVTHIAFLNQKTNYKQLIYTALGLENSNIRKNSLKSVLGSELTFLPRRRQDFDNIFLVTSSIEAKQIKPLLKFYYADNIPILATSNIVDYRASNIGNNNSLSIKDLDGIKFCDIPLILQNNSTNLDLISTLRKNWPNNYDQLIRLYALGIDSYNLSYNLQKLTSLKNIGVAGNTGHLFIDNYGKINRQLPWAEISNNSIKTIDVI